MQSVLIGKGSVDLRMKEIDSLCEEFNIHNLERNFFLPANEPNTEEAYGIALVRRLKQKAFLKPIHGKTQAIILLEADQLTLPAQHALLKLLEEPPDHTIIILTTENTYSLLETIRSRCRIIIKENDSNNTELQETDLVLDDFSVRNILLLSEKVAKANPGLWVSASIRKLHSLLIEEVTLSGNSSNILSKSRVLSRLQEAQLILKTTNTNPRLVLEHFLFNQ